MIKLENLFVDVLNEITTKHYWDRKKRIQEEVYAYLYLGEFLKNEKKFEALCDSVFYKQKIDARKLYNVFKEHEKKYKLNLESGIVLGKYKIPKNTYNEIHHRLTLVEDETLHENFYKYILRKTKNTKLEEVHLHVHPLPKSDEISMDEIEYEKFIVGGFPVQIDNFAKKLIEFGKNESNIKYVNKNYRAILGGRGDAKIWNSLKENIKFYFASKPSEYNQYEKGTVGDTVMTVIRSEMGMASRIELITLFYQRTDEVLSSKKIMVPWEEFKKFIDYYKETGRIDLGGDPTTTAIEIKNNKIFTNETHAKIKNKLKDSSVTLGAFHNSFYLIYLDNFIKAGIQEDIENFNKKSGDEKKSAYYNFYDKCKKLIVKINILNSIGHLPNSYVIEELKTAKNILNTTKEKMERILEDNKSLYTRRGEIN